VGEFRRGVKNEKKEILWRKKKSECDDILGKEKRGSCR